MGFSKNQIVWAKAKRSPEWPAQVVIFIIQIKKILKDNLYKVSFYNEHTEYRFLINFRADICEDDLYDFESYKVQFGKGNIGNKLAKAIVLA